LSGYKTLRFRITGASPLLMHNGLLADPLNPHAKALAQISARRRKTEADHVRLAELEFLGSLYLSGGMPCLPAEMIEAALVRAAAQERRGPRPGPGWWSGMICGSSMKGPRTHTSCGRTRHSACGRR